MNIERKHSGAAMMLDREILWSAVERRDAGWNGRLVYAVATTGIYCRPSCPSRRPRRENVRFFADGVSATKAGYRSCKRCDPDRAGQRRVDHAEVVDQAIRLMRERPEARLAEIAAAVGYSPAHFQRLFKAQLGISPDVWRRAARIGRAEESLMASNSVTEAIYAAGYESASIFHNETGKELAMRASAWKDGAKGVEIGWTTFDTEFGPMLLAATDRGICRLSFGENETDLARHFPSAKLTAGGERLARLSEQVRAHVERPGSGEPVSLDVAGTPFQRAIWDALCRIPPGETRSYAQLAADAGRPGSARAAGSANGANPVAVLVPCHRVIRADGAIGGYAYGEEIKRALLKREAETN